MKNLYKTPEIIVEELTKQDVLCSSTEHGLPSNPNEYDNQTLWKSMWEALGGNAF